MADAREIGTDWAATFAAPGPGGRMKVVYCYAFAEGHGSSCSRCGTLRGEHVMPDTAQATGRTAEEERNG